MPTPLSVYGLGAAAEVAKRKKLAGRTTGTNPPPRSAAVGSPEWLASASSGDIAAWLAAVTTQGPSYENAGTVDSAGIERRAREQAESLIGEATRPYADIQSRNAERQRLSTESARNFGSALGGILMGGKSGAEGMAYAKENFGGSYLGALAGQQVDQLVQKIAWDFDARDIQLAERIADIAAQKPELYSRLYADLEKGELARIEQKLDLADSAYDHRVKALGAILAQRRHEESQSAEGGTGKAYVSYFNDPATGARMGVTAAGKTVRLSGGKPVEQSSPSQVRMVLSNADQIVQESVAAGASPKAAVLQARMYLRDNGVKNFGQWNPYTTPKGPDAAKAATSKTYKMTDGSIWREKPDGAYVMVKPPGNTGKTSGSSAPKNVQAQIRAEIRSKRNDWSVPTEATITQKAAAFQTLQGKKVKLADATRAKVTLAKYVADRRYFKGGRWVQVLPGGFTDDPKKAARSVDYGSVVAEAMDIAGGLYALGWNEAKVRAWVQTQLRGMGITG